MGLEDALAQGLLPYLSHHARLQARLVSHQWRAAFSQAITSATLPASFWAADTQQQAADIRLLAAAFPLLQQLVVQLNWHHAPGYTTPSQQRSDLYISQLSDDSDDPDAQQQPAIRPAPATGAAHPDLAGSSRAHGRRSQQQQKQEGLGAVGEQQAALGAAADSARPQRKRREALYTAMWLPPWKSQKKPRKQRANAAAASGGGGAGVPAANPAAAGDGGGAGPSAANPAVAGAGGAGASAGSPADAGAGAGDAMPAAATPAAVQEAADVAVAAAVAAPASAATSSPQQVLQVGKGRRLLGSQQQEQVWQQQQQQLEQEQEAGAGMQQARLPSPRHQQHQADNQQQQQQHYCHHHDQQLVPASPTSAGPPAVKPTQTAEVRGADAPSPGTQQQPAGAAGPSAAPGEIALGVAAAPPTLPSAGRAAGGSAGFAAGADLLTVGSAGAAAGDSGGGSAKTATAAIVASGRSSSSDGKADAAVATLLPFQGLLQLQHLVKVVLTGPLPAVSWLLVVPALQACSSIQLLHLQQVYLPPAEQLQQLLVGWPLLRVLHLVVSLRSPRLQVTHIEALAGATQLQDLRLQAGFTDGGSGAQLEPLLALTGLTSLNVAFTGIMPDQRLALRHVSALSVLTQLRELASHGTARALLPQPSMVNCTSLTITGQRQRLAAPAMLLLSSCTQLQRLVLDSRKRVPAVAAVHLPQLAELTGLTSLTFGLTTGSLRAADTGQMLLLLSSVRGLQQLSVSADHRVRLTADTVEQLAGSWQRLKQLSLVNADPVDGLASFSGFRQLSGLNFTPAASQESGADQLAGLVVMLEGLPQLSDLRLNSRSLKLRHVQELVDSCCPLNGLTSLSLQLNTSTSVAATLQALVRLRSLKQLRLYRVWATFLSRSATQAALGELQQLWQLGLYVDDTSWVSELDVLPRQFAFLQQLQGLHELSLWLGQAFVSRAPREAKVAALLQQLVPLGCRLEWVAEPPDPAALGT